MSNKSFAVRVATRLRKNLLWSWLTQCSGHSLKGHSWIFIVGCYNSGTTLLEQILSYHPQISSLEDEGVMLTNALPRPEDFGWRRMWHRCENELTIDKQDESRVARHVKKQWSHFYLNKKWLLEKSISNTPRVQFLERHFKPAYFIHLVRNGYAVSEGIVQKAVVMPGNVYATEGRYPIEVCAQQWKRSLEVIEETKSSLTNFLEIRYEDLTSSPAATMHQVCQFLNLEDLPEDLLSKPFTVHHNTAPIANMNNRSIQRLTADEWENINLVAGDYLVKYGYYRERNDLSPL